MNGELEVLLPPPGNCCQRFPSITDCSLQVIHVMSGNLHTIVVCSVNL